MGTGPGVGVPESTTFAQALATLKREGSNVLLVGDADPGPQSSACRRLLGDPDEDARYRLFVRTDRQRCCDGVDSDHPVDGEGHTRYILQSPSGREDDTPDVPGDATETHLLGVLGTEFVETVDDFDDTAGSLDPSELRVCVDSLAGLLDYHQAENVFRLLHVMTTRIKQANGMGHYHLPVERDHEAVRLFEPLFDAVVELRSSPNGSEHRWHLRDNDTSSDWVDL